MLNWQHEEEQRIYKNCYQARNDEKFVPLLHNSSMGIDNSRNIRTQTRKESPCETFSVPIESIMELQTKVSIHKTSSLSSFKTREKVVMLPKIVFCHDNKPAIALIFCHYHFQRATLPIRTLEPISHHLFSRLASTCTVKFLTYNFLAFTR